MINRFHLGFYSHGHGSIHMHGAHQILPVAAQPYLPETQEQTSLILTHVCASVALTPFICVEKSSVHIIQNIQKEIGIWLNK